MNTYIDGKEIKERLLEKLNATIEANSEITEKQNKILVIYTKWLLGLTVVITLATIAMTIIAILK